MGDFTQGPKILEEIGFKEDNQSLAFDQRCQEFFKWITNNVTSENILSELEIIAVNDLTSNEQFLKGKELNAKLSAINEQYPNILNYTDQDVYDAKSQLQNLKEKVDSYEIVSAEIQKTKCKVNKDINRLEFIIQTLENKQETLYNQALTGSKKLQDVQTKIAKLHVELTDCIIKVNSPPLYTHQLPTEQYMLKCDSIIQYFHLYRNNNFEIKEIFESESEDKKNVVVLEKLKNQFLCHNEKFILLQADIIGLRKMMEDQDPSKVPVMNLAALKKQINEFEIRNSSSLAVAYQTFITDLQVCLQQLSHQKIEEIFYQNTKQKLERAKRRRDKTIHSSKIASNALKISEVIWILMQLDGERLKYRMENGTETSLMEAKQCRKRIDKMKNLQVRQTFDLNEHFVNIFRQMVQELGLDSFGYTIKSLISSFETFNSLRTNLILDVQNGKFRYHTFEILKKIETIENIFQGYIFDGPTFRPILHNIDFLKSLSEYQKNLNTLENNIRQLRSDYQNNITLRMDSDIHWKSGELLWIWFLTDTKKVITALEDIRKAAQDNSIGTKLLTGIKRQQ